MSVYLLLCPSHVAFTFPGRLENPPPPSSSVFYQQTKIQNLICQPKGHLSLSSRVKQLKNLLPVNVKIGPSRWIENIRLNTSAVKLLLGPLGSVGHHTFFYNPSQF